MHPAWPPRPAERRARLGKSSRPYRLCSRACWLAHDGIIAGGPGRHLSPPIAPWRTLGRERRRLERGGERQRSGGQEERSDISGNPSAAGAEVEGRRPGRNGSPCPTMSGRTEGQGRPGQQLDREKEESRAAFPATAGIAIGTNSGRSPGHPCGAYLLTVAFGAPIARYRSDLVTSPAEKDSGSSAPPAHSR